MTSTVCVPMLFGDVDLSGKIDIDDTLCVLNGFMGRFDDCAFEFVDIYPCPDGDGVIDSTDLDHMLLAFTGRPPAQCVNACRPCVGNVGPIASAGPDRAAIVNQGLTFDATASRDPDGRVVAYEWDFGDGDRAEGAQRSHYYTSEGNYTVRVYATDSCGSVAQDQATVTVTRPVCSGNNQPPVARGGSDRSLVVGERAVFNGAQSSDSDGTINAYWWSFGDGRTTGWQPLAALDHTYSQAGTYVVTLWTRDNCGASSAPDTVEVTVTNGVTLDPRLVGFVRGSIGTANGVALSPNGTRLYVASQEFGVVEFNVTNPGSPVFVRTSYDFEPAEGVVANASILMTGGATNAVKLIDLDTFGTPNEERVALGFVGQGMALTANRAALASGPAGYKNVVLDLISNPMLPRVVSTTSSAMFARGVTLSSDGAYAFVGAGAGANGGLKIIETATSTVIGSLAPVTNANSGDVELNQNETIAYVAEYGAGMSVVDVSNRTLPRRLSIISTLGPAQRVARMGNLLLVLTTGGTARLQVFDISTPSQPREVGSLTGQAYEIAAANGYAYLASGTAGMSVVDLRDPAHPAIVTVIPSNIGNRTACASDGQVALVGGNSMATTVLDVTDPADPIRVGQVASTAQDIAMFNHPGNQRRGYLAAGAAGLRRVNLNNPASPQVMASVLMFAKGVAILQQGSDVYALVAAATVEGAGRVMVVDISNPNGPMELVGSVALSQGGNSHDIAIHEDGRLAFVADYSGGVQVVDISVPEQPRRVGDGFSTGAGAIRIAVSGDLVLVSTSSQQNARLIVIDASDPNDMEEVGSLSGMFDGALDTFNEYALLPNLSQGLVIVDLSDPTHPNVAWTVDVPGGASSAYSFGNHVYVGDTAAILDVVQLLGF